VLDGVWRSDVLPVAGATVEVVLGPDDTVTSMTLIPDSQLTKEQAEMALAQAKEKGAALASGLVAKLGMPTLVAIGLLIVGCFFLTAVSYDGGLLGKMSFTFWRVLAFINADNALDSLQTLAGTGGSSGIYGFLGFVALLGPLVGYFWKDKRAALGGVLPLAYMLIVALMVRSVLNKMTGGMGSADDQSQIQTEMMKGVSIGIGAYVSLAAALYLAFLGVKKFLAGRS
jgi:hypothetical protein